MLLTCERDCTFAHTLASKRGGEELLTAEIAEKGRGGRGERHSFCLSDVGTLLGVALQIPAGDESGAGEQRVDTGLRLRRIEDELGPAIFLGYRVVAGDGDLSEGLAVGGYTVAENSVVRGVGK